MQVPHQGLGNQQVTSASSSRYSVTQPHNTPRATGLRLLLLMILTGWSVFLLVIYWLDYFDLLDGDNDYFTMACVNVIAFTGINVAVTLYSLMQVEVELS